MISFTLSCARGHAFDAWFRNNDDFDSQKERGLVSCPQCGSHEVQKALMAPSVATGREEAKPALAMSAEQKKALAQLQALSEKVRASADYVGDKFAEEARKIHFGESEARGIYGQATTEEARGLAEDGIGFLPLPSLPDDQN